MTSYLVFCFLGLLHLTSAGAIILFPDTPESFIGSDTLKIARSGEYNNIILNNHDVADSLTVITQLPIKGEVVQTGDNNRIDLIIKEIHDCTSRTKQIPDSMSPNASHNIDNHVKYVTGSNHIEIRQQGIGNKIKISSR